MKTETTTETTEKPTLESLGLKCTISPNGVRDMNDDGKANPMCAWVCTFTNARGKTENFDYFTGSGCGPALPELELRQSFPLVANVPKHNRHMISDKALLCTIAHRAAFRLKWTPDPIEVLWAICRDGDALESTFEDWASEFGYDTDSRTAEKVYLACQDNALRLRRILSADQMREIAQLDL